MKIYHIMVVIIFSIFTIFICTACEYTTYGIASYNEEIVNGEIIDIYIDTTDNNATEYYMDAKIGNMVYSIEINKHDFITYKVGDIINLKFRDGKFRCIVK